MSRDIKFRIIYQGKVVDHISLVEMMNKCEPWIFSGENFEQIMVKDCTLDEFTGLIDKNGQEIYEMDIMKYAQTGSMYPVRYAIDSGHAMFVVQPLRTPKLILHKAISETHEVVGNIHEDAEMLEQWARKIYGTEKPKDSA